MSDEIPTIVHPLGGGWCQPSRVEILIDDSIALMTRDTRDQLHHYEHSLPTAVYAGKMWRCREWLCWFGEGEEGMCTVHHRRIIIVENGRVES